MAASSDYYPSNTFPFGKFIAIVLFAVLGVLGGLLLSTHAVKRHGTDAEQIRRCLEKNGPSQTWQNVNDPDITCYVVDLGEECQGIMIVQKWRSLTTGCTMRERTSFRPGSGSTKGQPGTVRSYLERAGFVKVK